jgi:hypothetical protein
MCGKIEDSFMKIDRNSLFQLTADEFILLCAKILKSQGIKHIDILHGPGDQGIDMIGDLEGENIIVQVKHTRTLPPSDIKRIIDHVSSRMPKTKCLIIMTSAIIPFSYIDNIKTSHKDIDVRLIAQDDILKAINENAEMKGAQIEAAQNRAELQNRLLWSGITCLLISLLGFSVPFLTQHKKPILQERIETVEQAIGNLKDLEKQLTDIKNGMVEKQKAAEVIEQRYKNAIILDKITQPQIDAIKDALQTESWLKTLLNYVLGFSLGIASSLIASVINSRFKQNRYLQSENSRS